MMQNIDASTLYHNLGAASDVANQKRGASLPKGEAYEVAKEFESVFMHKMLQNMSQGVGEEGMHHSSAENIWRDMLNQHIADEITQQGGIGVTDIIHRQLLNLQEVK